MELCVGADPVEDQHAPSPLVPMGLILDYPDLGGGTFFYRMSQGICMKWLIIGIERGELTNGCFNFVCGSGEAVHRLETERVENKREHGRQGPGSPYIPPSVPGNDTLLVVLRIIVIRLSSSLLLMYFGLIHKDMRMTVMAWPRHLGKQPEISSGKTT